MPLGYTYGIDCVSRESLADAKLGEDHAEKILYIGVPDNAPQAVSGMTQMLGAQLERRIEIARFLYGQ
jgi:hypothetical protein